MDSFGNDPWARNPMIQTAENVARESEDQPRRAGRTDAGPLHGQYQDALADDAAFQKRYMLRPFEVKDARAQGRSPMSRATRGSSRRPPMGLAKAAGR